MIQILNDINTNGHNKHTPIVLTVHCINPPLIEMSLIESPYGLTPTYWSDAPRIAAASFNSNLHKALDSDIMVRWSIKKVWSDSPPKG